jgi:hypothetical protein
LVADADGYVPSDGSTGNKIACYACIDENLTMRKKPEGVS